jgi:hypothetical protein
MQRVDRSLNPYIPIAFTDAKSESLSFKFCENTKTWFFNERHPVVLLIVQKLDQYLSKHN